jgi:hypothetical protein
VPAKCVAGTYAWREGYMSAGLASVVGNFKEMAATTRFPACESCPAGYECPEAGTITPEDCGVGRLAALVLVLCVSLYAHGAVCFSNLLVWQDVI